MILSSFQLRVLLREWVKTCSVAQAGSWVMFHKLLKTSEDIKAKRTKALSYKS